MMMRAGFNREKLLGGLDKGVFNEIFNITLSLSFNASIFCIAFCSA